MKQFERKQNTLDVKRSLDLFHFLPETELLLFFNMIMLFG